VEDFKGIQYESGLCSLLPVWYCDNHWFMPVIISVCHAQSLAATNRVTEQLSWLAVESFFMSCSISWMASLIDNLYLLDLIVLVIN
jgi:hypothetical protein